MSMGFPAGHCEQAADESDGGANDDYDTHLENALLICTQLGVQLVGRRKGSPAVWHVTPVSEPNQP